MIEQGTVFRMKIFFKSGNSVIIDGVTEYGARAGTDGSLNGVRMNQQGAPHQTWLDIYSLDLKSVEAIVRLPVEEPSSLPTREA
ncbi:hypothetical protein FF100_04640 [Methylobacterium terricola]|uniref:Uncharacterized protein n=1 Tax=Methylobacterium terricola TaxID=2583531 RepID=A0A5C4LMS0_9HYPH|nr:hypothetical protein [Methylobacterium terricola]TNC14870.1 hypothetical protein FF100_04640 [Methylobacterium terricola]